jgi:Ser/Thr protein kinase RdoA (MazF antagonist)
MKTPSAPVSVSKINRDTEKELIHLLSQYYDNRFTELLRFDEKTLTSEVYLGVEEDGKKKVVKFSHWFKNDERNYGVSQLSFFYTVNEILRHRGVFVPQVHKNKLGEYITPSEKGTIIVLEFIEGSHFAPSVISFESAGRSLGVYNHIGTELLNERDDVYGKLMQYGIVEHSYVDSRSLYDNSLRKTLIHEHTCSFPHVCASIREHINVLDKTIERIDSSDVLNLNQPCGLLHFDFHVNNGLFDKGGNLTTILDIDQMTYGPFVWDVGNTLISFMSNALSNNLSWDVEGSTSAFLKGYHEVNQLSAIEYSKILDAALMIDMMRLLRSMRRHHFENDRHSDLYDKISTRIIPRFIELPKAFSFLDKRWIERNILQVG